MNLAVLIYQYITDKPSGIPDLWPAEVVELKEGSVFPPDARPGWQQMSDTEYADYLVAHRSEYDAWYAVHKPTNLTEIGRPPVVTTLNGSYTIVDLDDSELFVSGSDSGFSIILPKTSDVPRRYRKEIYNTTNQVITVRDNTGTLLLSLAQHSIAFCYLQMPAQAVWIIWQIPIANT
jgi:hypothetical protein